MACKWALEEIAFGFFLRLIPAVIELPHKSQKTVLDLLSENYKNRKLAPVGRLDKDT